MKSLINTTRRIIVRDKAGVTAVEYALIAGVMVAIIAVAFGTLGTDLGKSVNNIAGQITNASNAN